MKCKDCKWYLGDINGGECHRHSPIPISDKIHYATPKEIRNPYYDEIIAAWPFVKQDSWCGEFKAKKKKSVGRNGGKHGYYKAIK